MDFLFNQISGGMTNARPYDFMPYNSDAQCAFCDVKAPLTMPMTLFVARQCSLYKTKKPRYFHLCNARKLSTNLKRDFPHLLVTFRTWYNAPTIGQQYRFRILHIENFSPIRTWLAIAWNTHAIYSLLNRFSFIALVYRRRHITHIKGFFFYGQN